MKAILLAVMGSICSSLFLSSAFADLNGEWVGELNFKTKTAETVYSDCAIKLGQTDNSFRRTFESCTKLNLGPSESFDIVLGKLLFQQGIYMGYLTDAGYVLDYTYFYTRFHEEGSLSDDGSLTINQNYDEVVLSDQGFKDSVAGVLKAKQPILSSKIEAVSALTGTAQPLTAAQKQKALAAMQSASVASAAINAFNTSMVPGAKPGQDEVSQRFVQMTAVLGAQIRAGNCTVTNQSTLNPQAGKSTLSSFSITGANCPVNTNNQNNDSGTGTSTSSNQYASNSVSYSTLNDVDSMSTSTTAQMTQASNQSFNLTLQGTGKFHSQLEG